MKIPVRNIAAALFWLITGVLVADGFQLVPLNPYVSYLLLFAAGVIAMAAPGNAKADSEGKVPSDG